MQTGLKRICHADTDWVAITSLLVAFASLIAAVAAALYARNALLQAQKAAERDEDDWAQRQWFELYSKADEASEAIERFQVSYPRMSAPAWGTKERLREQNDLTVTVRAAGRRCFAFPKHPAIDKFLTAIEFGTYENLISPSYLKGVSDAVEGLREMAGVSGAVLKRKPMNFS